MYESYTGSVASVVSSAWTLASIMVSGTSTISIKLLLQSGEIISLVEPTKEKIILSPIHITLR
jgi:hypothetical protein